jgi:hypothetical protein
MPRRRARSAPLAILLLFLLSSPTLFPVAQSLRSAAAASSSAGPQWSGTYQDVFKTSLAGYSNETYADHGVISFDVSSDGLVSGNGTGSLEYSETLQVRGGCSGSTTVSYTFQVAGTAAPYNASSNTMDAKLSSQGCGLRNSTGGSYSAQALGASCLGLRLPCSSVGCPCSGSRSI